MVIALQFIWEALVGGGREIKRERERENKRERERHIETEKERQRGRGRQTDKKAGRQKDQTCL